MRAWVRSTTRGLCPSLESHLRGRGVFWELGSNRVDRIARCSRSSLDPCDGEMRLACRLAPRSSGCLGAFECRHRRSRVGGHCRRDRLAEIPADAEVATSCHLAKSGRGTNALCAMSSDLGYLEAWSWFHNAGRSLGWRSVWSSCPLSHTISGIWISAPKIRCMKCPRRSRRRRPPRAVCVPSAHRRSRQCTNCPRPGRPSIAGADLRGALPSKTSATRRGCRLAPPSGRGHACPARYLPMSWTACSPPASGTGCRTIASEPHCCWPWHRGAAAARRSRILSLAFRCALILGGMDGSSPLQRRCAGRDTSRFCKPRSIATRSRSNGQFLVPRATSLHGSSAAAVGLSACVLGRVLS